jgi:hypothetical protein
LNNSNPSNIEFVELLLITTLIKIMFSRAILRSGLTSRSSFQATHKGSALLSTTATSLHDSYENILVSQHLQADKVQGLSVGLITLNRPKTLNALSDALFDDLIHAAQALDQDDEIGSIVITGKGKAFAAGADIEEMSQKQFSQAYKSVCCIHQYMLS